MRLLTSIIILIYVLHSTSARCKRPRPNPVMGALQNILSPANAERTMQLLKSATRHTLGNTAGHYNPPLQSPIPMKYSPPILPLPEPCNLPINPQIPVPNLNTLIMPNVIQNQIPSPVSSPIQLQTPNPIQVPMQNSISYQMPNQTPLQLQSPPLQLPVQLQSPPVQVPLQLPSPPLQFPLQSSSPPLQMPVQSPCPPQQIPAQLPCQQLQFPVQSSSPPLQMPAQPPSPPLQAPSSCPPQLPSPPLQLPCQVPQLPLPMPEVTLEVPSCVRDREIVYPSTEISNFVSNPPMPPISELPVALTSAQDIYTCPLPSPAALFNLPAAYPGSSSAQDTAVGSRSQYLRKIPIPPPTL